jgi:GT2 family glycosyltransferase
MLLQTILINYKTPLMTLDSLATLMRELEGRHDVCVTVVDNASRDGSVQLLTSAIERHGWIDRVTVVETERNGGFAYGVNFGINALPADQRPDFVFLLNSDAFPGPSSIDVLLEFLIQNPRVGIAGSYIHGPDGETHTTAFRFPSVLGELEGAMRLGPVTRLLARHRLPIQPVPTQDSRVDWLAGASMLIRAELFDEVGPFDDRFFLYYEETDFCRRALAAGWETWYVPKSRVMHIGSVSTGMKRGDERMPSYWFESRAHYFRKNHGAATLWMANAVWVLAFASWRIRRAIQRKEDTDRPRMLGDFVRAWFGLRRT